ncbi:short coiled-coil protein B isoform X2 [Xenopus laevis]|uniref:Short coiled-coil protein B isoform X2 n=1 Tax=Xenopus laevis TaxID=8355 RepID=A0A8J1MXK4_XENLA|nr:short coiled-coil protein B isoform X2 [Xenopus laevis]
MAETHPHFHEGEEESFMNVSLGDESTDFHTLQLRLNPQISTPAVMNSDMDDLEMENQVELEEKTRLINQVLELQHTLEDLSARVDAVKEENLKLKSENQVLGQYIENLMSASSVFQTTDTKSKRK